MNRLARPLTLVFGLMATAGFLLGQDAPQENPPAAEEKAQDPKPFGERFPNLDNYATGDWWTRATPPAGAAKPPKGKRARKLPIKMDVPRDKVVSFAVYTHDGGTLKLSAQLYPLKPGEAMEARLELKRDGEWQQAAVTPILYPGWSAHFRLNNWDNTQNVNYRVRHGENAMFDGLIRKDPIDKDVIVFANLGCNSSRTPGERPVILNNLKHHDPDVLFFSGDQTYHHTQHTMGWLQFGEQFREVMRDRPTITIPDDHDVGQANLWGEYGKKATNAAGPSGGYFYPGKYVSMVERHQTWHLPDPARPDFKIGQDIGTYFTRLRVGGIDFAILEDRKFKSGPEGKIPKMGPRPDHINNPVYDRSSVDLPVLKLLGDEQLEFIGQWRDDWTGAQMKAVLSQTAFCGAVHKHGSENNRLLADLDSNAWPQTGRNKALREIRKAWAPHFCGDQHLAVSVKHGIEAHADGPYAFTAPAIVNTIYGRWWHPEDEKAGPNPVKDSPLPWTGEYLDGLGNKINMLAYANPPDRSDEKQRSDGYGIVRFNKKARTVTFECWPRFCDATKGDEVQFDGWPITFKMDQNDGREVEGYLPKYTVTDANNPVFSVIEEATGEVLYTVRVKGKSFQPRVYAPGRYTIKVGPNKPDALVLGGVKAVAVADKASATTEKIQIK